MVLAHVQANERGASERCREQTLSLTPHPTGGTLALRPAFLLSGKLAKCEPGPSQTQVSQHPLHARPLAGAESYGNVWNPLHRAGKQALLPPAFDTHAETLKPLRGYQPTDLFLVNIRTWKTKRLPLPHPAALTAPPTP